MNFFNSSSEISHFPVMLEEIIKICKPIDGGAFVDCTFGGGSYSKELLKFPNTQVLALDRDNFVIKIAEKFKKKFPKRFSFYNEKFSNLEKVIENKITPDSIIFDLGLSTFQLSDMSRGFSFNSKEKIDMSMGLSNLSAEEVINNYDEHTLLLIIKILGEEKEASKIVRNIIKARKEKKISKVFELAEIVKKSKKKNYTKKINVCTKTFQALRIFVNKETTELIEGIIQATKLIKSGGKIILVSFHSIEDKIIKFYFSNYSENKAKPSRYFPEEDTKNDILFKEYRNTFLRPTGEEILLNPPSRSAKLRYATRNNNKFLYPENLKIKFKRYLDLESSNV